MEKSMHKFIQKILEILEPIYRKMNEHFVYSRVYFSIKILAI